MVNLTRAFALLAFGLFGVTAWSFPLVDAKTGQSSVIVLPADASSAQRYAAAELRDHVLEMTGVRMSISDDAGELPARAVLIGDTRHTDAVLAGDGKRPLADGDGFRLVARRSHLVILGSPERGCLYGVYGLLEKCGGCRWYASWRTKIPKSSAFSVPDGLNLLSEPAFAMREPFWYDVLQHPEFAARLRVNSRSWRKTEAKYGGMPWRFDDVLVSCHTFNRLLPPERYFKEHPEYYSEIDGKRIGSFSQLCLGNPDVLRIVTSNVLDRIRKNPHARFYGISQNDWQNWCSCPICRNVDEEEGGHSGSVVRFLNAVADAVAAKHPDTTLETLAYQYSRRAPRKTRLRPNVTPCLCSIECDLSRPLESPDSKVNTDFLKDLADWSRQADGGLYVWDYATAFKSYTMPFANVRVLRDNVETFRRHRVRYLFSQGDCQGAHANFAELKAWLLAKYMWNPSLPEKELLDDFFKGFYGAAASAVRRYFDGLHELQREFSDKTGKAMTCYQEPGNPAITDEFLERAEIELESARSEVKDDPGADYAVRMALFGVKAEILERMRGKGDHLVVMEGAPESGVDPVRLRTLAQDLLADMDVAARRGNPIRLSEGNELDRTMRAAWRRIVDGGSIGNPRATTGIVEECDLTLMRKGPHGWVDVVDDPSAGNGKACKVFNTHKEWCVQLPLKKIAFRPGARYEIAVRLRTDEPSVPVGKVLLRAGVHNPDAKKSSQTVSLCAGSAPCAYEWKTIAVKEPAPTDLLWMAPVGLQGAGTAGSSVFVDAVRFVEAGGRAVVVKVDAMKDVGPIKPVNAVGQPPLIGLCNTNMFHYLTSAGVPFARLHDVGGYCGGNRFVDVPNVFRDFAADENDPKNYDFAYTDRLISGLVDAGVEPFYRLGVTIENEPWCVRRHIDPPKDFAKWARVCEHIIRHYTEGWAEGFRHRIRYWEIWNEPENYESPEENCMWHGDFDSFMRFYGVVATYLKERFPHLKIGGYGSCGFYAAAGSVAVNAANSSPRTDYFVACVTNFLAHAKAGDWPLDFFSYHSYSPPNEVRLQVSAARQLLDDYGFGKTEACFNEWLPQPSHERLGTAKQASQIAREIVDLQNGPCDMAMIYDAKCGVGNYSPLFNPMTYRPHKAYGAFLAFQRLRRIGRAVSCSVSDDRLGAVAAGKDGAVVLYVANDSDKTVPLRLELGDFIPLSCHLTDDVVDDLPCGVPDGMPPRSFVVIEAGLPR